MSAPILAAHDIDFEYLRGAPIIQGWSATFAAGSMTALTGTSGRGKSTLLYLLGLMLHPTAGNIMVDGIQISQMSDSYRARTRATSYGFVFQDAALDSTRTVMDNVIESSLYRGASRRKDQARAQDLLTRFGVDLPQNRKPGQVSGGQAQRIALCRALLNNPRILLADEPTGNLDPDTAQLVVSSLQDHAHSGAAVIVVTHSPEVAAACNAEIRL